MGLVVFLRGVNVGGHKAFKPAELARRLADFDAVNVGAAGTFVIRGKGSQAALRAEIKRHLPFDAEIIICPGKDIAALLDSDPFDPKQLKPGVKRYVTITAKAVGMKIALPIERPEGGPWQVKVVAVAGRFVLSLHRSVGKRLLYPNEVVEKLFNIPATTRNWNTIESIGKFLSHK